MVPEVRRKLVLACRTWPRASPVRGHDRIVPTSLETSVYHKAVCHNARAQLGVVDLTFSM
jgi:ketopantoate hydroxymethyltransferase